VEGFLFRFETERLIFFKEIFKKILRKVALKVKKLWKFYSMVFPFSL